MLHRFKLPGMLVVVLSIFVTLILFIQAKDAAFVWSSQWLRVSSQVAALLGTVFLSFSFILSAKARWLQRVFGGLDIMYHLHHLLGILAFILLTYHPILLAVQALPIPGAALIYISPFTSSAYLYGQLALVTMTILIMLTLFVRLPYNIWKTTHQWMGLALLFAALHIFTISSDTANSPLLRAWMIGWILVALFSFLFIKVFYRWFSTRLDYVVSNVNVYESVTAFALSPMKKALDFQPGQFAFLQFADQAVSTESHPFSIVSPPGSPTLEFWSKDIGDYTTRLKLLPTGCTAIIDGPYGNFMETVPLAKHVICVAGGIGITPFMSLMQSKMDIAPVTVVHTIKNQEESAFLLTKQHLPPVMQHRYIVHESESQGRLTGEILKNYDDNWQTAHYYFCGPPPMMEALRTQLLTLGIRPSKIFFEDFSFKQ